MHKQKGKRKAIELLRWGLVAVCVAVIIWSAWPNGRNSKYLQYGIPSEAVQSVYPCGRFDVLLQTPIALEYPSTIRFMETETIYLSVNALQVTENHTQGNCTVVVEAFLDMSDLQVEPGTRIFEPFVQGKNHRLAFAVTADRRIKNMEGNLWLYAHIKQEQVSSESERVPLFIVPLHINLKDMLGFPTRQVRFGSFVVLLLLLVGPKLARIFK